MAVTASPKRWSYSSLPGAGVLNRAREALVLLDMVRRGPGRAVDFTVRAFEETRRRVEEVTGGRLEGKRVLEIGPGQQLRTMRCFSLANEVVGIDMDVVPQRLTARELVRMIRANPAMRTVKTLVRKALRYDARFQRQLARALGVSGFRPLDVLRMDASRMQFSDGLFDFVCSYSVFEHIEDPEAALREIVRVLAPAGVAYVLTHLWTSNSGHHDPRIVHGELPPPYWPHLRPGLEGTIRSTTYCNRIRLPAWREMFERAMPGARFVLERQGELEGALRELRAGGELPEYADDELLSACLVVIWRKPGAAGPRAGGRGGA